MASSDSSLIKETEAKIRELKRHDRRADATGIIKASLETSLSSEDRVHLLMLLSQEYQLLGRLPEAEEAIIERRDLEPERPDGWLALASHFHYYVQDLDKAIMNIDTALQNALKDGNFVRQAYAQRIRIALDMKNYEAVCDSLVRLIEYKPKPGSIDVQLENDFVSRIPESDSNRTVLDKYKELSNYKSS